MAAGPKQATWLAPVVIADAGPLITLSRIGQLAVLPNLFAQVLITDTVKAELLAQKSGAFSGQLELTDAMTRWLKTRNPAVLGFAPHNPNLDQGEISSMALCLQLPGSLLIVDDKAARLEAQAQGLRFTGLVGVLIMAKHAGHLAQIAPVLKELAVAGYFLSPALVAQVLDLAGEA